MSKLAYMFREETRKFKDPAMSSEVDVQIGYPTTFLPFDFKNGMWNIIDNVVTDDSYENMSIGLGDGSINMIVGKTGTAKTTFAVQAATSIVAPFRESVIIHEDLEKGVNKSRIANISGWSPRLIEQKYILRQAGITAENFFERVTLHCNQKIKGSLAYPEEFTYDTGLRNAYGKRIYKIIPSVIILDSLPLLMPADLTEDEKLAGQMSTTAQAKTNARIFRTIAPKLTEANVLLFVVNHINQNININPFQPKQAQINYLKQDETIPGGFMALYLSNNIIKFTTSTKIADDKEFGINGFYSKVSLIKSRSNRAGQEVSMVYNQEYGFDRILSMYSMLKDEGLVRGAGVSFYLEGMERIKFSQKKFVEKFHDEPMLRACMRDLVNSVGATWIPKKQGTIEEMSKDQLALRLIDSFAA